MNVAFDEYLKLREEKGKPVAGYQLKILIDRLNQIADTDEDRIQAVKNAIAGEWSNFYPPNQKQLKSTSMRPKNAKQFESRGYNHAKIEKDLLQKNMKGEQK